MILHAVEAAPPGDDTRREAVGDRPPPVVLLHGLFGSAQNLGGVQRHLAARRRVVALDLRNHGSSPHGAVPDYATLGADVLETLDRARALPCALVGHSMGGKTAMRVALDRPDAVARLAVCDIAPVPYAHGFAAIAAAMAALALPPGLTRAQADAALAAAVPDPALRGFLLRNLVPGAAPHWRIGLRELAAGMAAIEGWDTPRATYPGPVLFVAGARSDYVRAADLPAIRALFPAADIARVPDAGHWLHADNLPGFLAVLDGFLT